MKLTEEEEKQVKEALLAIVAKGKEPYALTKDKKASVEAARLLIRGTY